MESTWMLSVKVLTFSKSSTTSSRASLSMKLALTPLNVSQSSPGLPPVRFSAHLKKMVPTLQPSQSGTGTLLKNKVLCSLQRAPSLLLARLANRLSLRKSTKWPLKLSASISKKPQDMKQSTYALVAFGTNLVVSSLCMVKKEPVFSIKSLEVSSSTQSLVNHSNLLTEFPR